MLHLGPTYCTFDLKQIVIMIRQLFENDGNSKSVLAFTYDKTNQPKRFSSKKLLRAAIIRTKTSKTCFSSNSRGKYEIRSQKFQFHSINFLPIRKTLKIPMQNSCWFYQAYLEKQKCANWFSILLTFYVCIFTKVRTCINFCLHILFSSYPI